MNMSRSLVALLALSCSPLAAAHAQVAGSQPADPTQASDAGPVPSATDSDQSRDIVVTAQRRSESLQKVPLAITAVTAADLDRSGIRDLQGIVSSVPNLNLGQQLGMAKIALRGVGVENISSGAEGSIAFHLNGVFLSRSVTALASFFDVQQVEVLRGPQGTLYGRNATGGAININTREPTQNLSGYFNITGGNYGRVTAEGAVGGAIVPDVLAVRVAFQTNNRDGFGENIVTGTDIDDLNTRAIRGSLLFTPTARLSIDLKADYFHERDRAGGYHYLGNAGFSAPGVPIIPVGLRVGGIVPTNVRDVSNDADPTNFLEFWGVSGKVSYDISDAVQISSLTAYRRTDNATFTDLDATNLFLTKQIQIESAEQFSEELQLSGSSDRLNWLLGFFYFHERNDGVQADPFDALRTIGVPTPPGFIVAGYRAGGTNRTDALAAFGQASYEIVDNLRLTLGARYSSELKRNRDEFAFDVVNEYMPPALATPQVILDPRRKRFKSFTPRIALDYQVTPDVLVYGSWSKGFKSGAYNLGSLQPPVEPERVSAFEGGIKSQFLDRRLRLNLAGFYYNYDDLQIGKVVTNLLLLENAATARIYGLEAELQAQLSPRFEVNANASWLHARFRDYVSSDPARPFGDGSTFVDALGDEISGIPAGGSGAVPAFNLSGNRLSQSPDFTAFIGAQYRVPSGVGEFLFRGEVAWRDRVYFTPFNLKNLSQAPNAKLNLFLNWSSRDENWSGQLYMKNVTNKTVVGNSLVSSSIVGFPINGYLEEPRTYGLTLGYKF